MLQKYDDIVEKLGRPFWWDEVGCPRYKKFHPSLCNNIYASQAVLLEIACQNCAVRMTVALSWDKAEGLFSSRECPDLEKRVKEGWIHYGDPPAHEFTPGKLCHSGMTMNCIDIRVCEFWKREDFEWKRTPELEIEIEEIKPYFSYENYENEKEVTE